MRSPKALAVVAIVLCSTSAFLGCVGGEEEASGTWVSRFEWLVDPVDERFPPADQALELPEFRVSGVHYWQGKWNFNFWTNLKVHRIDDDLGQIREQGFNTILMSVPWGYFQQAAFPPSYQEQAFDKLSLLLEAADRHRLYVILRIGTHEELPEGIRGRSYLAPYLLLDDRELEAYCDLFRETARRVAAWDHLLFVFFSWEDLSGHIFESKQDRESRLSYMKGAVAFRQHLTRKGLAHWNERWQTTYESLEDLPFPAYGSRAYGDFLEFADQRLMDVILPAVATAVDQGSPNVRLSYEIRVDSEPIWSQGVDSEPDWFDHRHTWNLIPSYPVVSAYFNPAWGATNEGGFIPAEKAEERLRYLLGQMEESIAGKPIFFDQLNFADSPPGFPLNSRLDGEEEIARFLQQSLDTLRQRSLGYAVWSFRAYEADSLYNSSFEDGLRGWETDDPARLRLREDSQSRERFLALEPGGVIHQESRLHPGLGAPFSLRLMARSGEGGELSIRFEVADESGWRALAVQKLSPTARWEEYQEQLSVARDYRLTLESTGSGAVELDELSLFNWSQRPSVLDQQGELLGRRSEILVRSNRSWRLAVGKIDLQTPWSWNREALQRAGHTYNDGWLPRQVVMPLLVPWFDAALELELYFPTTTSGGRGARCRSIWGIARSVSTA